MTTPLWTTTDEQTTALLKLIDGDPIHGRDREQVVQAILETAAENDSVVDPNLVRAKLAASVYPKVVGAVYGALRHAGVLRPCGWTTSDDKAGRNAGRPARTYLLLDDPRAADGD